MLYLYLANTQDLYHGSHLTCIISSDHVMHHDQVTITFILLVLFKCLPFINTKDVCSVINHYVIAINIFNVSFSICICYQVTKLTMEIHHTQQDTGLQDWTFYKYLCSSAYSYESNRGFLGEQVLIKSLNMHSVMHLKVLAPCYTNYVHDNIMTGHVGSCSHHLSSSERNLVAPMVPFLFLEVQSPV